MATNNINYKLNNHSEKANAGVVSGIPTAWTRNKTNSMSLNEAYKGMCEYRDSLAKHSEQKLKTMYMMATERKKIEDQRQKIIRQIDDLKQLMDDGHISRFSPLKKCQ